MDILSFLGFSQNSDLYQRLVVQQQKVDALRGLNEDSRDPSLFEVFARIKKEGDMKDVEEQILNTFGSFKDTLVPADKLNAVKKHLRYELALSLNNSDAIANTLAHYIALRRTPEALNRIYDLYEQITPEDVRDVARKFEVLLLILTHRDVGRAINENVGGHQGRVGVETDGRILAIFACLFLELRHTVQPSDPRDAVADPG